MLRLVVVVVVVVVVDVLLKGVVVVVVVVVGVLGIRLRVDFLPLSLPPHCPSFLTPGFWKTRFFFQ